MDFVLAFHVEDPASNKIITQKHPILKTLYRTFKFSPILHADCFMCAGHLKEILILSRSRCLPKRKVYALRLVEGPVNL